jgi:hypothetical protein
MNPHVRRPAQVPTGKSCRQVFGVKRGGGEQTFGQAQGHLGIIGESAFGQRTGDHLGDEIIF